jgi:large subunit ribosomal protein L21
MYAIVDILGEQVKVEKDEEIITNLVDAEIGDKVEFENVLLVRSDAGTTIGAPFVDGAKVTATVLEHGKGDKVLVFKKKRRKGYKVFNGHRQPQTMLKIEEIVG